MPTAPNHHSRNKPKTTVKLTAASIEIVHSSIKGRTRIYVSTLYRNDQVKTELLKQLLAREGIDSITANVLTGRLLIFHRPDLNPIDLVNLIARLTHSPTLQTATGVDNKGAKHSGKVIHFATKRQHQGSHNVPSAWHRMSTEQLLIRLASSVQDGLSQELALQRLAQYGLNELTKPQRRTDISILLGQFVSVPVGLLGASAIVSLLTGGLADAVAILAVVLINAGIGFVTERQAELTISALSKVTPTDASVIRDSQVITIPVNQVTIGDILLLQPGNFVAADARLLKTSHLTVDESALTGESLPVRKSAAVVVEADTPLSDRRNMVYMGTLVTGGTGLALVVATAYQTELGQIQQLVGEAQAPETPMQQQLDHLGSQLALLSGLVCVGVFATGLLRGQSFLQMLKGAISLAVAAVPEGLPAVATTTLALGIRNMRKENVAIRHLDAVESLGSVQIFCLDKTGTLTINRMSVVAVVAGLKLLELQHKQFHQHGTPIELADAPDLLHLLEIVSLCNDTKMKEQAGQTQLDGSPTEVAMLEVAIQSGLNLQQLHAHYPRIDTQARAEDRPYMLTSHHGHDENDKLIAAKGSPIELLQLCRTYQYMGEIRPLDAEMRETFISQNADMAEKGLRVLAVAYGYTSDSHLEHVDNLTWLGLIGMADPLRTGMPDLMHIMHEAGIHTVMITGDQTATAYNIGKQLNLSNGNPLQIMDSTKLDKLDPALLNGLITKVHVFARVSPAHKLRIVQAMQDSGHVVAMTGDGINDGPALKAADIGVAMGGAQTDVARSVADVVVEDDNLMTMINAIRQGRTIYGNIRKTIHYLVATNLSEIEVMFTSLALGLGQPLNPMQLLWINLITDIFPGLALAVEGTETDIMQRPPRAASEEIITRQDLLRMMRESGVITAGSLASYMYGRMRYGPGATANTHAFNTLVLAQLFHAISCRSDYHSIFSKGYLPRNKSLNWAIGASVLAQALAMLHPGVRRVLGVTPISLTDTLVTIVGAATPMLINEFMKPSAAGELRQRLTTKLGQASSKEEAHAE